VRTVVSSAVVVKPNRAPHAAHVSRRACWSLATLSLLVGSVLLLVASASVSWVGVDIRGSFAGSAGEARTPSTK
jgi:hypothetical protein